LLQIMTDTRNVTGHFHTICQTNTSYFPKSRVWLFGCHRRNLYAYAAFLRASFKSWRFCLMFAFFSTQPDQLIKRRQRSLQNIRLKIKKAKTVVPPLPHEYSVTNPRHIAKGESSSKALLLLAIFEGGFLAFAPQKGGFSTVFQQLLGPNADG